MKYLAFGSTAVIGAALVALAVAYHGADGPFR
jgi:hypothetical protein